MVDTSGMDPMPNLPSASPMDNSALYNGHHVLSGPPQAQAYQIMPGAANQHAAPFHSTFNPPPAMHTATVANETELVQAFNNLSAEGQQALLRHLSHFVVSSGGSYVDFQNNPSHIGPALVLAAESGTSFLHTLGVSEHVQELQVPQHQGLAGHHGLVGDPNVQHLVPPAEPEYHVPPQQHHAGSHENGMSALDASLPVSQPTSVPAVTASSSDNVGGPPSKRQKVQSAEWSQAEVDEVMRLYNKRGRQSKWKPIADELKKLNEGGALNLMLFEKGISRSNNAVMNKVKEIIYKDTGEQPSRVLEDDNGDKNQKRNTSGVPEWNEAEINAVLELWTQHNRNPEWKPISLELAALNASGDLNPELASKGLKRTNNAVMNKVKELSGLARARRSRPRTLGNFAALTDLPLLTKTDSEMDIPTQEDVQLACSAPSVPQPISAAVPSLQSDSSLCGIPQPSTFISPSPSDHSALQTFSIPPPPGHVYRLASSASRSIPTPRSSLAGAFSLTRTSHLLSGGINYVSPIPLDPPFVLDQPRSLIAEGFRCTAVPAVGPIVPFVLPPVAQREQPA